RLMHAGNVLDRDPTIALARLKDYQRTRETEEEVRNLAADAVSRGVSRHILKHGAMMRRIAFSPDGKRLVTSNHDKRIFLWDVTSGARLKSLQLENEPVELAYSPDGAHVAVGAYDDVLLWNVATGEIQTWPGHRGRINALAFSPDAMTLASTGD